MENNENFDIGQTGPIEHENRDETLGFRTKSASPQTGHQPSDGKGPTRLSPASLKKLQKRRKTEKNPVAKQNAGRMGSASSPQEQNNGLSSSGSGPVPEHGHAAPIPIEASSLSYHVGDFAPPSLRASMASDTESAAEIPWEAWGQDAFNKRDDNPSTSLPSGKASGKKKTGRVKGAKGERSEGKRAELPLVRSLSESDILPAHTLSDDEKVYLVENFAQFASNATVAKGFAARFGRELDARTLDNYNPDTRRCKIGGKLRKRFAAIRAEYVERVASQGIAHQAHRLRLLGDVVEKATLAKDFSSAIKGLELAAKEMGGLGSVTVKHEHKGTVAHVHANLEDAKEEVRQRLRSLVDGGVLEAVASPVLPAIEHEEGETGASGHGQA